MPDAIVIAEDTKNIREIMAFTLKNRGFDVHQAGDGNEVLPLVRRVKPVLLILDVMLPNKAGFEILADLRNDEHLRHTKVLMATAVTEGSGKDDRYWQGKTGADGFLSKPFRLPDFVLQVERLLGKYDSPAKKTPPKPGPSA